MLDSRYVQGVEKAPFDEQVTESISSYPIEGGGKTMVVGVKNLNGDTYRIIDAIGLGTYIHITSALAGIGLEDELYDSLSGESGFDSMFVVSEALRESLEQPIESHKSTAFDELENEKDRLSRLSETERRSIIQSRLGQGIFRKSLIDYWHGCAVSDCEFSPLLRASHIKPWREASNAERLDHFNGLLLAPNLDAAFDAGYISFDCKGMIIISDTLRPADGYKLRITPKLKIRQVLLSDKHKSYLKYPRDNVLRIG